MKYKKLMISIIFSMIGSILAQDNIINEIAKGGKFIVRDVEQNEAMVIEDGDVGFSGTLKLGLLPKGDIGSSIVVWDPNDKLLKLQNQGLIADLNNDIQYSGWHTLGYDGLADDNTTVISAKVQGTATLSWNQFDTDYGYISLGPANKYGAHIYTNKRNFIFNREILLKTGVLGSSGSNLQLQTSRTTRVFIKEDNGNVGIGTTNPSAKLEVAGQVKITGGAPGPGKVLTSDATGLATWQIPAAGGGISLWTESGNNVFRNGGRVGIGTANPSAKLDVAGQVKITGGTPGLGKVLTSDATGLASWQTPSAGGGVILWTESGNNVYRNDGNVGIGTSNPSVKLDVNGSAIIGDNTSSSFLHVGDNYTSTAPNSLNPGIYFYKNGLYNYGIKLQYTGSEYGTMMFGPNVSNTFLSFGKVGTALEDDNMIEYMRVDLDNGNVGIGTTNPSAKLDVNGTVSAKRYVIDGLYDITNGVWDLSRGNLAQVTYNSSITPITINSDGRAGTYVLVVKKNASCIDCSMNFLGADVKYPSGVTPTLSSGSNTTDIFSFIAIGNNTFYCLYAKNLL